MSGCRVLTDAQLEEACELREQGWTIPKIRRRFERQGVSVSDGAIAWHLLRLGADAPPERRARPPSAQRRPARRGNHIVRPFTPAEDELIKRLSLQGLGPALIGKRLTPPRPCNSIIGRLMTLARHEARREEAVDA